jgi:hypothetical protein
MRRGRCIAAVGIVVHINKLYVEQLVEILNKAAESIGHELEETH